MRLVDYLDKGASLGPGRPLPDHRRRVAGATARCRRCRTGSRAALVPPGVRAGRQGRDPVGQRPGRVRAACSASPRAGAVWCPINPRNEAAENRELLDLFDCTALIFQAAFAPLVAAIRDDLPAAHHAGLPRRRGRRRRARRWAEFLGAARGDGPSTVRAGRRRGHDRRHRRHDRPAQGRDADRPQPRDDDGAHPDELPVRGPARSTSRWRRSPTRPGVLCFPVLALGGEIVVMRAPDVGGFLGADRAAPRHAHLPAADADLHGAGARVAGQRRDLSSLQCFWYGAAPMSATRLEEALARIGPVMAQLFGQTEAPMMISTMAPADHFRPDGRVAAERLSSAGRPAPAGAPSAIMDERRRRCCRTGERGEIVVRGSLVMAGYYQRPGGHRRGLALRLAPHRRHRLPRRRRLPVHRRPRQGHDHHRRLQRLLRPRSSRR